LPEKAPESDEVVTEDLLKKLHHVLMEVRVLVDQGGGDVTADGVPSVSSDSRRGGINELPRMWSCLPNIKWDTQYGVYFFAGTNVLTVI